MDNKKKTAITADSTCDLSEQLINRYGIGIMPLKVILGAQTFCDGVDIVPQDIFDYVDKTGELPKTAAPTIEEYKRFFEEKLQSCGSLIHFDISSKASSSYSNAKIAAQSFKNVYVVDTLALSTGQALLALKACDLAESGAKPAEIVEKVNALRGKVNTSFVPDALDYLHKGGRCSLAALMGAKVLKLHPLIAMREGSLSAVKKYMGNMQRCVKNYVADLAKQYPVYDDTRCFITHSLCPAELVEEVKQLVARNFCFKEVSETTAGCVVTGHCGRNTIGVLFISG